MVSYLKNTADQFNIKWQPEILPRGGTDTSSIQKFNSGGSIAGAISIPTRNLHSVIEMAHKEDIYHSIQLLKRALTNLDSHDWNW
jgi:endoglucanase